MGRLIGRSRSSLKCPTSPLLNPWRGFVFQTEILGKFVFIPVAGPGEGPNWGGKVRKGFFGDRPRPPPTPPPPALSKGLDNCPSPLISRSGYGTVFFCLVVHCLAVRISLPFYILYTSCYCTDPGLQLWDPAPFNGLSLWTSCYLIFWHFRSRFHINQNAPCVPPQILPNHCHRFPLGRPRKNWKQWFCKILWGKQGVLWSMWKWWIAVIRSLSLGSCPYACLRHWNEQISPPRFEIVKLPRLA